ncbi:MAG: sigma-70 family RNA polymerase sigma factor [Ruminococcaceae bacterium]|nr:sigma-70 family RNA polymerase sigma factor [Oscillospiraceae bacterium]
MEDAAIIKLYEERSENAISETDAKYGRYCRAIAYNILHNSEDTDECVSDTYLHVWNAIPPQKPNIFKAFIGRITRNLSLHRYEKYNAEKRSAGQVPLVLDELCECIPGAETADSLVDGMAIKKIIEDFLRASKPDARKIFVRRYFLMETVKTIASELSVSESKVTVTLCRMREKLRASLQQQGIEI